MDFGPRDICPPDVSPPEDRIADAPVDTLPQLRDIEKRAFRISPIQLQQPRVRGTCAGRHLDLFLDTGAGVSLIKHRFLVTLDAKSVRKVSTASPDLRDVNDQPLKTYGIYVVIMYIGGVKVSVPVVAVDERLNFPAPILVGMDFLTRNNTKIDFGKNMLLIKGKEVPITFTNESEDENVRIIHRNEISHKVPIRARVLYEQSIPAYTGQVIKIRLSNGAGGHFIFQPYEQFVNNCVEGLVSTCNQGTAQILVINSTGKRLALNKRLVLGKAVRTDVAEMNPRWLQSVSQINTVGSPTSPTPLTPSEIRKITDEINPFVNYEGPNKRMLLALLARYRDVLALPGEPVGRTHLTELSLKLIQGAKPIALAPYKIPHSKEETLDREIQSLLSQGLIRPTVSPWAAPVVLVAKPDGSTRLCVDYRKLNALTEADNYPLPVIDDLLMDIGRSKIFSQIDLLQAYHQVPLAEGTGPMTAFKTRKGHYEYTVAPFGLKQMPAVFQRLMNQIFNVEPTNKHVAAYLDDLLVHSESIHDHLKDLEDVFIKLREAGLKIKLKKCNFLQSEVKYLGYELTDEGFKPQKEKVSAISEYPQPASVDDIRSFLGMAGYYRIYIPNFSTIAKPLTNMLKKEAKFEWTGQCEVSFQTLKKLLISAPVLAYPDYKEPFIIETDASNVGIGAVLSQKDPETNRLRPILYTSRLLKAAEQNYSATEREALAVINALNKFKYVVYGYQITVLTDHKPLTFLFTSTLPPGRLGRWALCVQEYGIKIQYKPGKYNVVPDALSRHPVDPKNPEPELDLGKITLVEGPRPKTKQPVTAWAVEELVRGQQNDPIFGPIYRWLETDQNEPPKAPRGLEKSQFRMAGGILHYQETGKGAREGRTLIRVVVPSNLVDKLLRLYHDLPTAGHRGTDATVQRIERHYVVQNLRKRVERYVADCTKCATTRKNPRKVSPRFQYIVIPKAFHQVHFDILGPMPLTGDGYKYVICYVDRFTRYTILDALKDRTATSVARSLFERVIAEYTTPSVLLSDNALEFTSSIVRELCRIFAIKKAEITAYVPAANGLAEAANKRILGVLRTAVQKDQKNWKELLPHVQVALNSAYHAAIGDTPHYLLFLNDKILPFETMFHSTMESQNSTQAEFISEMRNRQEIAYKAAQRCLVEEESRYRHKYNLKAKTYPVREGYRVYLKTRIPPGVCSKLYPKYEGPYRVMKELGRQRYLVKNLGTGAERTVHADYTKIVPESCTTTSMNEMVRLPHPRLKQPRLVEDIDEDDDLDGLIIEFPFVDAEEDAEPRPETTRTDATAGTDATAAPHTTGDQDATNQPHETTTGRLPTTRQQSGRYGLRQQTRPPNRYGEWEYPPPTVSPATSPTRGTY